MLWHNGLSFIFAAKEKLDLSTIEPTGITAMKELGLRLLSKEYQYWSSFCPNPLNEEQIVLHNLLINPISSKSMGYTLLFLRMHKFDRIVLQEEASYLGIMDVSNKLIDFLDGNEVKDPYFPTRNEFNTLCQQYGVD